jgi:Protein of unknown function (DUF4241)
MAKVKAKATGKLSGRTMATSAAKVGKAKAKVVKKVAAKFGKATGLAKAKVVKKVAANVARNVPASVATSKRTRVGKTQKNKRGLSGVPAPGVTMAVSGFVAVTPPPPLAVKRELAASRDVARLLRYGEQFGSQRIEIRWLPTPLPCPSGGFALVDPGASKSLRVLDRKVPAGTFRCMLAVAVGGPENGANARTLGAGQQKLAAVILHCGRPPIARWTVAHFAGSKPPSEAAQLPSVVSASGWLAVQDASTTAAVSDAAVLPAPVFALNALAVERRAGTGVAFAFPVGAGAYTAYWGVDDHDKAVCLVIDFDVFTQKDWRSESRG